MPTPPDRLESRIFHLLLVEDNPGDARLLERALAEAHEPEWEVRWVSRLSEGLRSLDERSYDAVVLDLGLPDSVGLETFRAVHARAPELPVVVLSGAADDEIAVQAVHEGAQDYLVKGEADSRLLTRALRYAIERGRIELERERLLERLDAARLQAEQDAAQFERLLLRYRALVEDSPDAMLSFNRDGVVVDANPAASRLLGFERAELTGLPLESIRLWTAEDLAGWIEQLGRGEWRSEVEITRKDGSVVPVDMSAAAVEQPNGVVGQLSLRDISERRAVEQLQRDFLAMVSHELRNPLAALLGWSQVLLRGGASPERGAAVIESQARHLDRLISDLLDVARFDAGHLELERRACDLVRLARDCIDEQSTVTERHRIALHAQDVAEGLWDQDRLRQVLTNLLSNAIKYSPNGGDIDVVVTGGLDQVRIAVSDRGTGIPAELQPHIFEKFYRVETARGLAKGLGLGLYITRAIVRAHGGDVFVVSSRGEGSTFCFTLPYAVTPRQHC